MSDGRRQQKCQNRKGKNRKTQKCICFLILSRVYRKMMIYTWNGNVKMVDPAVSVLFRGFVCTFNINISFFFTLSLPLKLVHYLSRFFLWTIFPLYTFKWTAHFYSLSFYSLRSFIHVCIAKGYKNRCEQSNDGKNLLRLNSFILNNNYRGLPI